MYYIYILYFSPLTCFLVFTVYCPNPGTIANGKIYKNGLRGIFDFQRYIKTIRHGDRILYKCKEDFVLEGPSGATCVNGQWRPAIKNPDHKCKRATHAPFPKQWIPLEEMTEKWLLCIRHHKCVYVIIFHVLLLWLNEFDCITQSVMVSEHSKGLNNLRK